MRSVEDHLEHCLSLVGVLAPREVPLLEALDRVLAQDVVSPLELPPFACSAMDGYAVRLADVTGASIVLPVAADVPAGPTAPLTLAPGTAVRVMTGAALPEGTEGIVPVEWTDAGTETVTIDAAQAATLAPGQYVRPVGEDVRRGETVLRAGTRLTPRHIGVLAAVGRATAAVHPAPRVVVVSTGSELVPPGNPLGYGQIHDSNGYALTAAAAELGAVARYDSFVGDDEEDVARALDAATRDADLVITSGGVSAGAYDPVKAVLRRTGDVWFGKVAMQPGMPQGAGTLLAQDGSRVPVLTLPGNPVSSMVSFEVFARPVIRRLAGETTLMRPSRRCVAEVGWTSPAGKRQYVRAVYTPTLDGEPPTVRPVGAQGSHLLADLAEANCLAVVGEPHTRVEPGDELRCLLLERVRS